MTLNSESLRELQIEEYFSLRKANILDQSALKSILKKYEDQLNDQESDYTVCNSKSTIQTIHDHTRFVIDNTIEQNGKMISVEYLDGFLTNYGNKMISPFRKGIIIDTTKRLDYFISPLEEAFQLRGIYREQKIAFLKDLFRY